MSHQFPIIQPNGSLLLAWQVKNRHVLVIGGGEVAAGRIFHLLSANAKVTVVAPRINDEIAQRETDGLLYAVYRRGFEEDDLTMYERGVDVPVLKRFDKQEYLKMDKYIAETRFEMVLVAIDDPVESKRIYYMAKRKGLNVNIADVPPLCDFYFGAVLRKGDLQVMVSTNGKGPRMAKLIKDKIWETFEEYEIQDTIEVIGQVRKLLRGKCPGGEEKDIKLRMEWMTQVTDLYSFKEWSVIDPVKVIEYFPKMPPTFDELQTTT